MENKGNRQYGSAIDNKAYLSIGEDRSIESIQRAQQHGLSNFLKVRIIHCEWIAYIEDILLGGTLVRDPIEREVFLFRFGVQEDRVDSIR
jgi:hypothetical protein